MTLMTSVRFCDPQVRRRRSASGQKRKAGKWCPLCANRGRTRLQTGFPQPDFVQAQAECRLSPFARSLPQKS